MSDIWWGWLEYTIFPVSHPLGIFLEKRKSSFAREGGGQWEEGGVGSGASLAPPVSAITCSRYCRRSQIPQQHRFWWSLEPCSLWRVSGVSAYARTLLLDPATSITELARILLLYLAGYLFSVLDILLTSAFDLPGFPATIFYLFFYLLQVRPRPRKASHSSRRAQSLIHVYPDNHKSRHSSTVWRVRRLRDPSLRGLAAIEAALERTDSDQKMALLCSAVPHSARFPVITQLATISEGWLLYILCQPNVEPSLYHVWFLACVAEVNQVLKKTQSTWFQCALRE